MFIATWVEYDWKTSRVLARRGYHYFGPVARLKGASAAQENLANQQAQFYQTMSANYATQFAGQNAILSSLKSSFQPILDAGVNQYGFSPTQDTALRTQATDATALQYANASKALGQNIASQSGGLSHGNPVGSGGETYIPSGAIGEVQGDLAAKAAQQESSQMLGITNEGYNIGRQNYNTAAGILGGVSSQMNPLGYASSTNQSGNDAFNSATTVQKMNNAASPWGTIGGILGGVAGSFLGPIGGALGSQLGGMLGGGGGGGGSTGATDATGYV